MFCKKFLIKQLTENRIMNLYKNIIFLIFTTSLFQALNKISGVYILPTFDETIDEQRRYITCLVVGALYRDKFTTSYVLNATMFKRINCIVFYNFYMFNEHTLVKWNTI